MNVFYRLSAGIISAVVVSLLPQWVAALTINELKKEAEEITVLIPESFIGKDGQVKNANGSGSIIAKEGENYTVLTASHVVCKDPEESCKDYYDLKVITHDGSEYIVNNKTIKKLPGVDLAVLQFKSDRNYKLAKFGNYPLAGEQFIFASGWPDPKFGGKRERFFSIGKVLPQDITPLFKIYPTSLGYELVYTCITFGGMSGGPVLDTEGRVIAVHGQNEGARIEGVRVAIGFSLGIPIQKFLELAPQASIQGNLNVENAPPSALPKETIGILLFNELGISNAQNNEPTINWLNQANKLLRLGQIKDAISAYDEALKLDPNLYQAWFGKGLVFTYWKKPQEAIAAYSKVLEINPDFSTAQKLRDKLKEPLGVATPVSSPFPTSQQQPVPAPSSNSKPGNLW